MAVRQHVRIETRCPNMRRHLEAHRFGTPAERRSMPTCPQCHPVVVNVARRPHQRGRDVTS